MATPDLLFIVLDDVGWRDFEALPLPNMRRLADSGTRFRKAFSMPLCSPSRYTVEFGQYGFRDGVGQAVAESGTPLERLSLAAHLHRERDYQCLYAGKWHLDLDVTAPQTRGYQAFRAGHMSNIWAPQSYTDWERVDDGRTTSSRAYNSTAITDAAVAWWKTTPGPRFAAVNYHAPHKPWHLPPRELLGDFAPKPGVRGLFEAMTVALDFEIGRLLDGICGPGKSPADANTLVFLYSDNGMHDAVVPPGVSPLKVKQSGYDGGINVPFVAAGPAVRAGAESQALIHLCDLFGTVAELTDTRIPEGEAVDTLSFLPALSDPGRRGRTWLWSQSFRPNGVRAERVQNIEVVRTSTHKLMNVRTRESEEELFFDLRSDPEEEQPLAADAQAPLRKDLAALRDSLRAQGA